MKAIYIPAFLLSLIVLLVISSPGDSDAQELNAGQVRVIESDARHIVLEISAPEYQLEQTVLNGNAFTEIRAKNWGLLDTVGHPQVPLKGILLTIPQNANPKIKLLKDRVRQETLAAPISPVPTPRVIEHGIDELPTLQGQDYLPDARVYGGAAPSPADVVKISAPMIWRSQRYVRVQFFPFQFKPAEKQLAIHQKMRVQIDFGVPSNAPEAQLGQSVSEGAFEEIFKQNFLNYEQGRAWRKAQKRGAVAPQIESAATTPASYKISVMQDGMYRVTCADMQNAGVDTASINFDKLALSNLGQQVAIKILDANGNKTCDTGDGFIFWGQAAPSETTVTNIYWLTLDSAAPKRMTTRDTSQQGTPVQSFTDVVHLEQDLSFFTLFPNNGDADHWFWYPVPHPADVDKNGDNNSADFTFTAVAPDGTGDVTVLIDVTGYTLTNHTTRIFLNGNPNYYEAQWNGQVSQQIQATFPASYLVDGINTIRYADALPYPNITLLNYMVVSYASGLTAHNNTRLILDAPGGLGNFQISGFATNDAQVFDVTDAANVVIVSNTNVPSGNFFTAQFNDSTSSPRDYFALTGDQFKTPISIALDTPSNLKSTANGADYIFISHADFLSSIQPLAQLRASAGMRVQVVDVQDVYDEFNHGMLDPEAIRKFLAYTYESWQPPAPQYVLLVGNGNYNIKNSPRYSPETIFIPVMMRMVDPWIGMTATDNYFVTLDSNSSLPSMAIGRLPITSMNQATVLVNKLTNYEQNTPAGAWRKNVTFYTDNAFTSNGSPDQAGNFWDFSDQVAGNNYYMPSPMGTERIYYNPCTNILNNPHCELPYPSFSTSNAARTAFINAFNAGRLIINYVGHASPLAWAGESLFGIGDLGNLTPGGKLPFMLPMTCYDGYFHEPGQKSLSEALTSQGLAIGSFAPSGLGVAHGHDYLDRGFFEAIMQGGKPRVGQATIAAKVKLYAESGGSSLDLLDTYNLLGDPGTLLALPDEIMPTPTPTKTNTPTLTHTPTLTRTPTNTLTPTHTPTVTNTPPPTNPGDPTWTPSPTATSTPIPGACDVKPVRPELAAPENDAKTRRQRVILRWNGTACATRYKVIIKQGSRTGPRIDRKVVRGANSYQTITLPRRQVYWWRVRAINSFGGSWSEWRQFTIQ